VSSQSGNGISLTGIITEAITAELGRRSAEIDATTGLRCITLIVQLNERTGKPRTVLFRSESKSELSR